MLCILLVSLWLTTIEQGAQAEKLKAQDLFQTDQLMEVQIKMASEDWKKLRSESDRSNSGMGFMFGGEMPTDRFTQFKADIKVNGTEINQVGIRTKGFIGSLNSDRPSFKIKFDEYVDQSPVKGLDRLTLNNNVQDESLASQYLTYKLFNKAGIPAPRVSFAKVTVNGEYLGVYSHVESVRSPFLKNHFGDDSGEFYEGTLADFYPKAIDRIEAKNKRTRKDKSRAIELAKLVETQEGFNLKDAEELVNLDQFIRFWAMENLIAFWDGYSNNQNNYFAYASPEDGNRFHFMPWGADGAFTDLSGPFGRMRGGGNIPKAIYSEGMLNNRLYHSEGIPKRYKAVMQDLLENVWAESEILADLDRIQKLTRAHLHDNQDRVERGVERVTEFVQSRRAEIESELENWPISMGEPRLPLHVVEVGSLKGSFATNWRNEREDTPLKGIGSAKLDLVLDGETISLSDIGIVAQPEETRGFGMGGPRTRGRRNSEPREPRATLELHGIRPSDGHRIQFTFMVDKTDFKNSSGKGVSFQGMMRTIDPENNGGRWNFGGMPKTLTGSLIFKEADVAQGASVAGRVDMTIQEARGGMFSRMRGGGPGRGGPPSRGEGPRNGRSSVSF